MDFGSGRPLSVMIIPLNRAFVKCCGVVGSRLFPAQVLECHSSVLLVEYGVSALAVN